MARLDALLFQHVAPLRAGAVALPEGGVLFADGCFEDFLREGRVAADAEGPPGLSAGADWEELRTAWRRVLPLETVSYEGWLAELQTYANLDWSGLDALGINL
ncbi:hypothetical protein J2Z79_001114 [Symbiobacterium terraclitae]|uniref:Uncharacterized protein n=1 Tax=Symbiobacterium terraclitae TaxID=557451 RepID=A0ABS4JQB1_9FIRM|nr:hypothetical protein [Symbiobacterium terraclitae]MBP2017729.1 hypothetical protein [Symbiobacterium terraclitae]